MANDPRRLAGIAYIAVDGKRYQLQADAAYAVSTVQRSTLTGMDGVHGYSETPVPGHIKATLRDAGNLSVAAFNAMTNATVTLELANGKTIVGRNMWTVEAQEVKATDATFEVTWEGQSVEELTV